MRSFNANANRRRNISMINNSLMYRRSTINALNLSTKGSLLKQQTEQDATCCNKCLKAISHSVNIIKAFIMRLIFSMHSFIAICIVYTINHELWCLVNVVGVVFLLIELFVTIIKRKGKEPKWFFPCFFIYICTMIPPIWFIELHRIDNSRKSRNSSLPITGGLSFDIIQSSLNDLGLKPDDIIKNATIPLPISVSISHEATAVTLEISLMLLVILGRWFLPKGSISRSTLSQLLLVYMSLASDIVDLLSLLNETQVQESITMICTTLAIFSWSLFQFSLNLVVTRGRSFQGATDELEDDDSLDEYCNKSEHSNKLSITSDTKLSKWFSWCSCKKLDFLDSEIWSILVTLIFQDGPFFALRLTAVINFNVRTFVTMFFTCKNAIILFLQVYRLVAIYHENEDKDDTTDLLTNFPALALNEQDLAKLEGFSRKSLMLTMNGTPTVGQPTRVLTTIKDEESVNEDVCCKCDCHKRRLSKQSEAAKTVPADL